MGLVVVAFEYFWKCFKFDFYSKLVCAALLDTFLMYQMLPNKTHTFFISTCMSNLKQL